MCLFSMNKKIRQKQNIKYNNYKEKTNLNIYSEDTFLIINPFEGRTRRSFFRWNKTRYKTINKSILNFFLEN